MLQYGGGGHKAAGTCQIDNDKADQVLQELIKTITADG
jgi:nanoRNase/pAp phosphatase (c-di-AMP/oligoRNAs hydrolase)